MNYLIPQQLVIITRQNINTQKPGGNLLGHRDSHRRGNVIKDKLGKKIRGGLIAVDNCLIVHG